jgi:multicomponent K+:H+ antiporter subunit G
MIDVGTLPAWAALSVAFFVVFGAVLTLIGSVGLLRLATFYQRMHAPTLGTSLGSAGILIGSIIFFSFQGTRPVVHEILLMIFVTVTTPVSFILLMKATRSRPTTKQPEQPD